MKELEGYFKTEEKYNESIVEVLHQIKAAIDDLDKRVSKLEPKVSNDTT